MTTPDRLTIITHSHAGSMGDQAIVDVAAFYGINSETFDLDRTPLEGIIESVGRQKRACVAIAAATFVHLTAESRRQLKRFFEHSANVVGLIHSIYPDIGRGAVWLREFLEADVTLVRAAEDRRSECCFTKKMPEWTGPLTGAVVGRVDPSSDSFLQVGRGRAVALPWLTPGPSKVGGEMIAGQCRLGAGSIHFISARPPDETYSNEGMAAWLRPDRVSRLLPLFVFVRGVFGSACWHQPRPHASFLWADARIVQRPDSIDLRDVAEEAHRLGVHVCLAMPPSEFARFDPGAGKILRQYLNHLSVAPYGNDSGVARVPSNGSPSPILQAWRRMAEFGRRAKIGWRRVLIDPGAVRPSPFSVERSADARERAESADEQPQPMSAETLRGHVADLRACGCRSVVGAPIGRDARSPWKPYEGVEPGSLDAEAFPVIPLLAQDDTALTNSAEQAVINAFLGKPSILEFRPEWFAPQGAPSAPVVMERLAALEVKPVWSDPETLSRSLYLLRRSGSQIEVRMFADEVVVQGVDLAEQQVEVIPPISPLEPLQRVSLDGFWEGRWIPTRAGDLQFEILDEGELRLSLRREPLDLSSVPLGPSGLGLVERLKQVAWRAPTDWIKEKIGRSG